MVLVKNNLKSFALAVKKFFLKKRTLYILFVLLFLFVISNLVTFFVYKNSTYPNTRIAGQKLGSVQLDKLDSKLDSMILLPDSVRVNFQDYAKDIETTKLGIVVDNENTAKALSERHWLPVANLFVRHNKSAVIKSNDPILQKELENLAKKLNKNPTNAALVAKNGNFKIKKSSKGVKIDIPVSKTAILEQVSSGADSITLVSSVVEPKITESTLAPELQKLQSYKKTKISYKYKNNSRLITMSEIVGLYVPNGSSMIISDALTQNLIESVGTAFGIRVENLTKITAATKNAIKSKQDSVLTLVAAPKAVRTFTYCTAVKGVSSSYLSGLESKLQSVYGDKRGWSLDGLVSYRKVSSGCDFTVWLSAAKLMPTFGAICDSSWSCTVSPNVILNFDRWQGASPAWNQKGGSLDDYRSMVINHETGHWLGFGHAFCAGSGQKAPVMQQQSISLQGCNFNPWPLSSEQAVLKQTLGI